MKQICGHVFYSSDEAAKLLGVTPRTLQRWFSEDSAVRSQKAIDLNPVTELNGRRLFRSEEIHRLVEQTYGIRLDPAEVRRTLEGTEA